MRSYRLAQRVKNTVNKATLSGDNHESEGFIEFTPNENRSY
jgi:hypothetical protein